MLHALARRPSARVGELADELGLHPNSVRLQLDALCASGDVRQETAAADGRGRPARVYAATTAGRAALASPEDDPVAGGLVPALVEHLLAQPDGPEQATALGVRWGARALGSRRTGSAVADLLTRQGFAPEWRDGALVLRTCPLLEQAREHPEVVCGLHSGLLSGAGELAPFSEPDGCRVSLG